MVDLTALDSAALSNSGMTMTLRDPNGKPVEGVSLTVLGRDSDKLRRVYAMNGEAVQSGKASLPDLEGYAFEAAVSAVIGWTGIEDGGKPLDCTPDNVRLLFRRASWIRRQVERFRDNEANFMKALPLA